MATAVYGGSADWVESRMGLSQGFPEHQVSMGRDGNRRDEKGVGWEGKEMERREWDGRVRDGKGLDGMGRNMIKKKMRKEK